MSSVEFRIAFQAFGQGVGSGLQPEVEEILEQTGVSGLDFDIQCFKVVYKYLLAPTSELGPLIDSTLLGKLVQKIFELNYLGSQNNPCWTEPSVLLLSIFEAISTHPQCSSELKYNILIDQKLGDTIYLVLTQLDVSAKETQSNYFDFLNTKYQRRYLKLLLNYLDLEQPYCDTLITATQFANLYIFQPILEHYQDDSKHDAKWFLVSIQLFTFAIRKASLATKKYILVNEEVSAVEMLVVFFGKNIVFTGTRPQHMVQAILWTLRFFQSYFHRGFIDILMSSHKDYLTSLFTSLCDALLYMDDFVEDNRLGHQVRSRSLQLLTTILKHAHTQPGSFKVDFHNPKANILDKTLNMLSLSLCNADDIVIIDFLQALISCVTIEDEPLLMSPLQLGKFETRIGNLIHLSIGDHFVETDVNGHNVANLQCLDKYFHLLENPKWQKIINFTKPFSEILVSCQVFANLDLLYPVMQNNMLLHFVKLYKCNPTVIQEFSSSNCLINLLVYLMDKSLEGNDHLLDYIYDVMEIINKMPIVYAKQLFATVSLPILQFIEHVGNDPIYFPMVLNILAYVSMVDNTILAKIYSCDRYKNTIYLPLKKSFNSPNDFATAKQQYAVVLYKGLLESEMAEQLLSSNELEFSCLCKSIIATCRSACESSNRFMMLECVKFFNVLLIKSIEYKLPELIKQLDILNNIADPILDHNLSHTSTQLDIIYNVLDMITNSIVIYHRDLVHISSILPKLSNLVHDTSDAVIVCSILDLLHNYLNNKMHSEELEYFVKTLQIDRFFMNILNSLKDVLNYGSREFDEFFACFNKLIRHSAFFSQSIMVNKFQMISTLISVGFDVCKTYIALKDSENSNVSSSSPFQEDYDSDQDEQTAQPKKAKVFLKIDLIMSVFEQLTMDVEYFSLKMKYSLTHNLIRIFTDLCMIDSTLTYSSEKLNNAMLVNICHIVLEDYYGGMKITEKLLGSLDLIFLKNQSFSLDGKNTALSSAPVENKHVSLTLPVDYRNYSLSSAPMEHKSTPIDFKMVELYWKLLYMCALIKDTSHKQTNLKLIGMFVSAFSKSRFMDWLLINNNYDHTILSTTEKDAINEVSISSPTNPSLLPYGNARHRKPPPSPNNLPANIITRPDISTGPTRASLAINCLLWDSTHTIQFYIISTFIELIKNDINMPIVRIVDLIKQNFQIDSKYITRTSHHYSSTKNPNLQVLQLLGDLLKAPAYK